ncbi:MAG: hypothetical protein O7B99_13150 [Planctomycetota bacterium]|nr:hypothetical protein [Planctomycetota bacterium]
MAPSETQPGGPAPRDLIARWLLAAACLFALVRFWRLGEWSLWHDEALALSDALQQSSALDNRLGYSILSLFLGLFETRPNEFWLRFIPACLGWLTVPLTWWAFRPLAGSRRAAAAALLVAVWTWHVYWSQNARFYTLAQDLALVGGGLVLRGYWRASISLVVLGFVFVAAGATAHPSVAFLFAGLVGGTWVARELGFRPPADTRRGFFAILGVGILIALVGAGWLYGIWDTWQQKKSPNAAHFLLTSGFFVTPLIGIGTLVGIYLSFRREIIFGAVASCIVATSFAVAVAAALYARMSAQYVFVLLPWIAVVAALPVGSGSAAAGESRRKGFASTSLLGLGYLALLVLPTLADLTLYFVVRHGDRPRWREAYRYVFDHQTPGDLILGMEAPVGEYYLDPDPQRTEVRKWTHVAYLDRFRAELAEEWARYPRRVWFIVNLEQLEDWEPEAKTRMEVTLREECRLMKSFDVKVTARDLDVLVYLRE